MSFGYRHRKVILLSVFCVLMVGGIFSYICYFGKDKKESKKNDITIARKSSKDKDKKDTTLKKEKKEEKEEFYKVDIKGQIRNPGIYSLKVGSRIDDVIREAGGLLESSDTSVINLSKKIHDEMVIIIYSKEEVSNFKKTKEVLNQVIDACISPVEDGSIKNDACIDKEEGSDNTLKVSINTAGVKEFMMLDGIGESKAEKIVKYREEHGPFESIEDIKKVDGIGDSIYDKIKENLTL